MADVQIVEEILNSFVNTMDTMGNDHNDHNDQLNFNVSIENLPDMHSPVTTVNELSELRDQLDTSARSICKISTNMNRFHDDWIKKNSIILRFEAEINYLKDDLKRKSEELENADLNILHLTDSNQTLTIQNQEHQEEINKLVKQVDSLKNELDAKTKLAEIYIENDSRNKSYIDGLNLKAKELAEDTATKWLNMFGGGLSASVETQKQQIYEATPTSSLQILSESAGLLADSPPPDNLTIRSHDEWADRPTYEHTNSDLTILEENSLESDKAEVICLDDDVVNEIEKPSEVNSSTSSVTPVLKCLKRTHDESISIQHKRFRETNSEATILGENCLVNDKAEDERLDNSEDHADVFNESEKPSETDSPTRDFDSLKRIGAQIDSISMEIQIKRFRADEPNSDSTGENCLENDNIEGFPGFKASKDKSLNEIEKSLVAFTAESEAPEEDNGKKETPYRIVPLRCSVRLERVASRLPLPVSPGREGDSAPVRKSKRRHTHTPSTDPRKYKS